MSRIKLLLFIIIIINILNVIICDKIKSLDKLKDMENDWKEFKEFREWKKWKDNTRNDKVIHKNFDNSFKNYKKHWSHKKLLTSDNDTILMARYVVNQASNITTNIYIFFCLFMYVN